METVVANASYDKVRSVTKNGREYLVAPITLIVPGVLPGSQGPLLYPLDHIVKSTPAWNNMPIVVYHPKNEKGEHISASEADVPQIGFVQEAKTEGKLAVEGWFDVEDTRAIDERVLNALKKGEKMEISTGLYTKVDEVQVGSTYKGRSYIGIAHSYVPDHVAILPDLTGACSNKDGCGMLVNRLVQVLNAVDNPRTACACKGGGHLHKENHMSSTAEVDRVDQTGQQVDNGVTKKEGNATLSAKDYAYVPDPKHPSTWKLRIDDGFHVAAAVAALGPKGFMGNKVKIPSKDLAAVKSKVLAAWKKFNPDKKAPSVLSANEEAPASLWQRLGDLLGITDNDISHGDLRTQLVQLLNDRKKAQMAADAGIAIEDYGGNGYGGCWIQDVYDSYVVYQEMDGTTYKQNYTVSADDIASLTGDPPVEVTKVTQYKPLTNSNQDGQTAAVVENVSATTESGSPSNTMGGSTVAVNNTKLTPERRSEIVSSLVANSATAPDNVPWKGKDVVTVNNESEDTLILWDEWRKSLIPPAPPTPVANRQGFFDGKGNWNSFDVNTGQWVATPPLPVNNTNPNLPVAMPVQQPTAASAAVQAPPPPVSTKAPVVNMVPKPENLQAWLQLMPNDAAPVWNSAMELHNKYKEGLIERLTANLAEPGRATAQRIYNGMDVPTLKVLADMQPVNIPMPQPMPLANNYLGAIGGFTGNTAPGCEQPLLSPSYQFGGTSKN